MSRRRLWCYRCNRRALFPALHYLAHLLDVLRHEDPARPPLQDPPAAAGRAEQWARIDALITRTTGRA